MKQAMQMAIHAAGFTATEADRLRQAMGSKRSPERMAELRDRLMAGMAERGITEDVAEDIYVKLHAFSGYGFPESHSVSMASIVWCSSFVKRYYPAAFTAALLNNQPMGFYSPASLVTDARRHDVEIRRVDVNASEAGASLQPTDKPYRPKHRFASPIPQPALRQGLSSVRDLGSEPAERIVADREANGPFADLEDFVIRTVLPRPALESLATAGAFGCFGVSRREALWTAGALAGTRRDHLPGTAPGTGVPQLDPLTPIEQTLADLWATGTTPADHPAWSPTASARRRRTARVSWAWRTRPASSTSSVPPRSGSSRRRPPSATAPC